MTKRPRFHSERGMGAGSFRVLALLCLLCLFPAILGAQSTPFGKIIYAPDRAWSWALRQWPALTEVDKTEDRSAGMTGLVTWGMGKALSKATPMSFRRGRETVAAVYGVRALYGVMSGETHRYRAHVKHVAAATFVATVQLRFRF